MVRELLYTKEMLKNAVNQVADQIREIRYANKITADLLLLINLKGAILFASDLMRVLKIKHEIDFCQTSLYGHKFGVSSEDEVYFRVTPGANLNGKHVVIVDDIIDTGKSMDFILRSINDHFAPFRLDVAVLLDKPARRSFNILPYFVGIRNVPDLFLFGYGLDFGGWERDLEDIYAVRNESGF